MRVLKLPSGGRSATFRDRLLRREPKWLSGLALATVIGLAPMASLASTWTGATGNWSSNTSPGWNATGVPNAAGATALFSGGTAGTTTQDVGGGISVGTLDFSSGNVLRTITMTNAITVNQDGAGSGFATISNTNASAGSTNRLAVGSGTLTLGDDLLISNSGGSTSAFSISITSTIGGTGSVTVANGSNSATSGAINLGAANSFTGSVLVQKGVVILANTAFGGSGNAVTLGSASSGSATLLTSGSSTNIANSITVASGTGGTLLVGSTNTGTSESTFSGAITLNGNLSVTSVKTSTGGVTFTKVISGAGGLTKIDAGLVTLSAANTYTGNTVVNAGTLTLSSSSEERFKIQNANASNEIFGASGSPGALNLNGLLRLDISTLTATSGSWNLVDVNNLTESFGGGFSVAFVGSATPFSGPVGGGSGTYSSGGWSFSTSTGALTLVPEPASLSLLGTFTFGLLTQRNRRRFK